MTKQYWKKFYKKTKRMGPSSFAKYVLPFIDGAVVDIGCGEGRDTRYFAKNKIPVTAVDQVLGESVESYIKRCGSPDNVYARFFWHSIPRKTQQDILKWTTKNIFIEARTTEDFKNKKIYGKHYRNFVSVPQLVSDLKQYGFQIIKLEEGTGLSPYKGEDPHLVRVIATK